MCKIRPDKFAPAMHLENATDIQHLVMLQRCARQWLRAAKQGQYAQASGLSRMHQAPAPAPALARRLSNQSSASKAAMQLQQQQQAAQEAEQKLMAFCQTAVQNHAEAASRHPQEAESPSKAAHAARVISASAQQAQQPKTAQQPKPAQQQVWFCLY